MHEIVHKRVNDLGLRGVAFKVWEEQGTTEQIQEIIAVDNAVFSSDIGGCVGGGVAQRTSIVEAVQVDRTRLEADILAKGIVQGLLEAPVRNELEKVNKTLTI